MTLSPHSVFAGTGPKLRFAFCICAETHFITKDIPMPTWLIAVCAFSVCVAAAYLLYVILKPEDF